MRIRYKPTNVPFPADGCIMQEVDTLEIDGVPYTPPPAPAPQRWECEVALGVYGTPIACESRSARFQPRARVTLEFDATGRAWVKPTERDKELAIWLRQAANGLALGEPALKRLREAADRLDGGEGK